MKKGYVSVSGRPDGGDTAHGVRPVRFNSLFPDPLTLRHPPPASLPKPTSLRGEITFWHSFTQGPRLETIQAAADQFMTDHPKGKNQYRDLFLGRLLHQVDHGSGLRQRPRCVHRSGGPSGGDDPTPMPSYPWTI